MSLEKNVRLTRRALFGASLAAAAAGMTRPGVAAELPGRDGTTRGSATEPRARGAGVVSLVRPNYARVPLRKESPNIAIIQSPDIVIDSANAARDRQANLAYMQSLLGRLHSELFPRRADLVCFHEMPLHGFGEWNREQALRVAIEAPGEETEALGRTAAKMNCYISFGSYVRDRDWPGHVIMMGLLIGPDGKLAARQWKARGSIGGLGLFTSTVYDCLDRYVEMYGLDALVPVARTDIGNLCISGVQYDPLLFLTMALKGAEIVARIATGGLPELDARAASRYSGLYTAYANSARSPEHSDFIGGVGTGGSMFVGPDGEVIARADPFEQALWASVPLGEARKQRQIPNIPWDVYAPHFAQYRPKFSSSWFLKYLPKSWTDTRAYFRDKANW